jgi:hypothetical protein
MILFCAPDFFFDPCQNQRPGTVRRHSGGTGPVDAYWAHVAQPEVHHALSIGAMTPFYVDWNRHRCLLFRIEPSKSAAPMTTALGCCKLGKLGRKRRIAIRLIVFMLRSPQRELAGGQRGRGVCHSLQAPCRHAGAVAQVVIPRHSLAVWMASCLSAIAF